MIRKGYNVIERTRGKGVDYLVETFIKVLGIKIVTGVYGLLPTTDGGSFARN